MRPEPARTISETAANVTVPVPVGVSGLTFLGVTFKDWVMIGTGLLLTFQLVVILPKAIRVLRAGRRNIYNFIKEVITYVRNK